MKIVFILDEIWDSALTHYALGVYDALKKNNEVTLFCLKDSFVDNKIDDKKVYIKQLRNKNIFKSLSAFLDLARKLRNELPDRVFTILGDATFFACLLKKTLNFEIFRIFGENKRLKSPKGCIDYLILPSDKLKINIDKKKTKDIFVIRGFADDEKFKFSKEGRLRIRKEFDIDDSSIVFGAVGRLDAVKGYPMLLTSFSNVKNKNSFLVIVGEEKGESLDNLKAISENLKIEDRVIFIAERRRDISDIMSAFDIGVVSSVGSENIARVFFEFLLVGIPIVTTRVGMLKEVANDKFSISANPNEMELSEAMNSILDKDLKSMRENALEISKLYSKKQFNASVEDILNFHLDK